MSLNIEVWHQLIMNYNWSESLRASTYVMMWYGPTEAKIEPAIVAFSQKEPMLELMKRKVKSLRLR
jgi:hypothetical protein